jgi:hypothetical protein
MNSGGPFLKVPILLWRSLSRAVQVLNFEQTAATKERMALGNPPDQPWNCRALRISECISGRCRHRRL